MGHSGGHLNTVHFGPLRRGYAQNTVHFGPIHRGGQKNEAHFGLPTTESSKTSLEMILSTLEEDAGRPNERPNGFLFHDHFMHGAVAQGDDVRAALHGDV